MAYPPGFLFTSPPLSSCASVVLGPRAGHEGSAFAPYSAASGPHATYGAEPRAFLSPGFEPSSSALDFHPFAALGPCHPYADPAYRKNATRDATATLKAWLGEHRKNPYPTKGEKIMLAIITKMTLTQVSTWFANARRRLKKENKMTWTPRNRSEDEEEPEDLEAERGERFERARSEEQQQEARQLRFRLVPGSPLTPPPPTAPPTAAPTPPRPHSAPSRPRSSPHPPPLPPLLLQLSSLLLQRSGRSQTQTLVSG
ncbi:hypothetical protein WMY93_023726 [Mugilogobius chulae]|uniref:Homeobox domain-containing protein n=1 Tax=Mugilogobius chulae TaxID=88201 RepID=A0AAW0N510_9GOBI